MEYRYNIPDVPCAIDTDILYMWFFLPARASEQGNVIGLESVYI